MSERLKSIFLIALCVIVGSVIVLSDYLNNQSTSLQLEHAQILLDEEKMLHEQEARQYRKLISDILEQEQTLLTLELSDEEKSWLQKVCLSEEEVSVEKLQLYVGMQAYIIAIRE